ncbi:hypothetical protein CVV38_01890 [Candidatus Peregrinibacteria bacterium HGW-Peregrinibacteria-1]|nr:MAG: hypothetical protein CVV38_01890 [Candidatus Peregrinibacteria bacterium HGW-Peregrinibacteria-1]
MWHNLILIGRIGAFAGRCHLQTEFRIIFTYYLFCVIITIMSSDHASRDMGKAYMLAAAHLIAESKISMVKIT